MRVTDISLTDVVKRYLKVDACEREGNSNRYKTACPFHKDHSPSMLLYDKTDKGLGWDYHCYVCGAHGTAPTMLAGLHIVETEEDAVKLLRHDYNMELPDAVDLQTLCELKGLDMEFAEKNGWKTVERGVEIPFFDIRGNEYRSKIRVKYEGKDKYIYSAAHDSVNTNNIPYGLHWLDAYDDDVLYLTEGETDCMTLRQAGYPAIGIMGANGYDTSYATYFSRFASIVLVRDNDEAGWKLLTDLAEDFNDKLYMTVLPNGVKDINNYHVFRCNSDPVILRTMFDNMPILPATPDTFVASVVAKTVEPTDTSCWTMVKRYKKSTAELLQYKDTFSNATKVSKTVVTACIKAATASTESPDLVEHTLIVDGNAYFKRVMRNGSLVQERITNFIVEPQYDINTDGEIIRVCNLENTYGKTVSGVHFDAETLSAPSKFNCKCMSVGDFIFSGTIEDLFQLCSQIFSTPKRVVHSPRRIGLLDDGSWLFGNCGITPDGTVVPVEDGLVILGDTSYAPRSISIDVDGGDTVSADLPTFNLSATLSREELATIARDFRGTFGTLGAWQALGWVVAGWFSTDIFTKYGYFPYLFVNGKRASGKSVMCTMLSTAFGYTASQSGMSIENPTNVGILRYLGYRSSMPQWYDDYRNDVKRIQMKDGLLLDVYNRHGAVKGTRDGGTVRQEKINGFLLLSGEDTPQNNALLTRCVVVQLSAYERNALLYKDAQEGMAKLSVQGLRWAASQDKDGLLSSIDTAIREVYASCGDDRYAGNNGIFLGAFRWAFKGILSDKELAELTDHIKMYSTKITNEQNAEHPLAMFFNDFPDMARKGLISRNVDFKFLPTPDRIAFRLASCHKAWEDYHNRVAPIGKKSYRGYLEKERFFIEEQKQLYDGLGRQRSSIINVDMMQAEFPDFCAYVDELKEKPDF